jgi:hypothetical protein
MSQVIPATAARGATKTQSHLGPLFFATPQSRMTRGHARLRFPQHAVAFPNLNVFARLSTFRDPKARPVPVSPARCPVRRQGGRFSATIWRRLPSASENGSHSGDFEAALFRLARLMQVASVPDLESSQSPRRTSGCRCTEALMAFTRQSVRRNPHLFSSDGSGPGLSIPSFVTTGTGDRLGTVHSSIR